MQYIRTHLGKIAAAVLLACAIVLTVQRAVGRRQADMLQQMDARLDAMAERHAAVLDRIADQQAEDLRREMDGLRAEVREELAVPPLDLPLAADLQRHTLYRCAQFGVASRDVFAIMAHESGFDPAARGVNRDGTVDTGLMQINSVNWDWLAALGVDVHTPEGNIDAGVVILAGLQAKGYDRVEVLAAYAAGEAGMLRGEGFWFTVNLHQLLSGEKLTRQQQN